MTNEDRKKVKGGKDEISILSISLFGYEWGFEETSELNSFLLQYFINYNLNKGWYLVSAPINTANWNADSSNRWIIHLGGGAGKVIRIGKLPVNLNAQLYYNIEKPEGTGDYTARIQLQFMFPK